MDLTKYHHIFNRQAHAHLDDLERLFDDSGSTDSTQRFTSEFHDRIHSIKGMALTLQLETISSLCQSLEQYLDGLPENDLPPLQDSRTILADGIAILRHLVDHEGVPATKADTDRLSHVLARLERIPARADATPQEGRRPADLFEFGEFVRPLKALLPRFCRQFGKEVRLEIEGADLALPFDAVAPLRGILTDLLEYCVACSIEPPPRRLSLGKSRRGQVVLVPALDGTCLVIQLHDDGCGIRPLDRQKLKVLRQTKERGGDLENSSSTATETAGNSDKNGWAEHLQRISRQAEALHGSLTFKNDSTGGTAFTVRLPLQQPL